MAAGHFHIRRRRADLGQIVRGAIQVMQPLLDRRHQELQVQHDAQLPPSLYADATRLQQVLVNLLSNASKYSPMEAQLGLALQRQGDDLLVQVHDQGPGLPADQRDQVFQRFVRLSNQDGTQPGVGLGLSVVRTVVEEHGGRVGVESSPGSGAVFWFTIPLEAPV
jgi:signal transduction histidine kinase